MVAIAEENELTAAEQDFAQVVSPACHNWGKNGRWAEVDSHIYYKLA